METRQLRGLSTLSRGGLFGLFVALVAWGQPGKSLGADTDPPITLFRHGGPVFALAYSPDGKWLVSGSYDRRNWPEPAPKDRLAALRVWDVAGKREARSFHAHAGRIYQMAFAPDGKALATAGDDGRIRFWDLATRQQVAPSHEPTGKFSLSFSPDGKHLASTNGDDGQIVDVATGRRFLQLKGSGFSLCTVAFSPDGKTLASIAGTDQDVHLWDPATGKEVRRLHRNGFGGNFISLDFLPDGKTLVACGNGREIIWWETATGLERLVVTSFERELPRNNGSLATRIVVAPDGWAVAAADMEKHIWLLDAGTGKVLGQVGEHADSVQSLAFAPDGRSLASGCEDGTIAVWDLNRMPGRRQLQVDRLSPEQCKAFWNQLLDDDAPAAYQAIVALSRAPVQVVPSLQEKVRPVPVPKPVPPNQVASWLRDLKSNEFAVREAAANEWLKAGRQAVPQLEEALKKAIGLDLRRRLERILKEIEQTTPEDRQALRAIEILERTRTPEARQVLQALAKGLAEAPLTREAQQAFARLARQNAP